MNNTPLAHELIELVLDAAKVPYESRNFIHFQCDHEVDKRIRKHTSNPLFNETEIKILHYMAAGYSCREVADAVFKSTRTIEAYHIRLKDKLGAKSMSQLIAKAILYGFVDTETIAKIEAGEEV